MFSLTFRFSCCCLKISFVILEKTTSSHDRKCYQQHNCLMNTDIQTPTKYGKTYWSPFCISFWTLGKKLTPQDLVLSWLCISEETKGHRKLKLSWRKWWPWWNAVAATAVFLYTLDNKMIHHGKIYISYVFLWNSSSAPWRDSACLLNIFSS